MYSQNRKKGNIAEEVIVSYLKNIGFQIFDQNYFRKWGEIDIVAEKSRKLYFIEVKSSVLRNFDGFIGTYDHESWEVRILNDSDTVSYVMPKADPYLSDRQAPPAENTQFNPVWNMTNKKKVRFSRIIRTYLADKYRKNMPDFQVDLVSVLLDFYKKIAYIRRIENILFDFD